MREMEHTSIFMDLLIAGGPPEDPTPIVATKFRDGFRIEIHESGVEDVYYVRPTPVFVCREDGEESWLESWGLSK